MMRRPPVGDASMRLAKPVRSALVQTALTAYEDAALGGLCHEGAWEAFGAPLTRKPRLLMSRSMRTVLWSIPMVSGLVLGCGEQLKPSDVAGTYSLRTVENRPVP